MTFATGSADKADADYRLFRAAIKRDRLSRRTARDLAARHNRALSPKSLKPQSMRPAR